jgi:hypothetical protein
VLAAPAGWLTTDALERDNDFCNACHLSEAVPLHIEQRRDFDRRPPETLAALHATREVAARPSDPAFRCIDCHGGVGLLGRARVKTLAAKDAFWWMVGRYDEPEGMRWPLWDADCRKCHARLGRASQGPGDPAFHDLSVHNVRLGVGCVECHLSHQRGGSPEADFLHVATVRRQCARCHPQFEEGEG